MKRFGGGTHYDVLEGAKSGIFPMWKVPAPRQIRFGNEVQFHPIELKP